MLESGEAREVHHFCLLTGYGADAINPYLAFEAIRDAKDHGHLKDDYPDDDKDRGQTYRKGVRKGMLKVMGKMGISTLASYKGAQIFEALGLKDDVIDKCFAGTPSRMQGCRLRYSGRRASPPTRAGLSLQRTETERLPVLPNPTASSIGVHDGEKHGWNPFTIAEIQQRPANQRPKMPTGSLRRAC